MDVIETGLAAARSLVNAASLPVSMPSSSAAKKDLVVFICSALSPNELIDQDLMPRYHFEKESQDQTLLDGSLSPASRSKDAADVIPRQEIGNIGGSSRQQVSASDDESAAWDILGAKDVGDAIGDFISTPWEGAIIQAFKILTF